MNDNGQALREKMLGTFGFMLRPARMILNLTREELSRLSGLPLEVIAGAEDGLHRLHEQHYLALAAVFDNTKYTEEASIYHALVRILTPEGEFEYDNGTGDFMLVKRWFATFSLIEEDEESYDEEGDSESEEEEVLDDSELDALAANSKFFVETSALKDRDFPAFVGRIEPFLRRHDGVLSVPSKALEEFREYIEECEDYEKPEFLDLMDYVTRKISEGLIKIREYDNGGESLRDMLFGAFSEIEGRISLVTNNSDYVVFMTLHAPQVTSFRFNEAGDLIVWG